MELPTLNIFSRNYNNNKKVGTLKNLSLNPNEFLDLNIFIENQELIILIRN